MGNLTPAAGGLLAQAPIHLSIVIAGDKILINFGHRLWRAFASHKPKSKKISWDFITAEGGRIAVSERGPCGRGPFRRGHSGDHTLKKYYL